MRGAKLSLVPLLDPLEKTLFYPSRRDNFFPAYPPPQNVLKLISRAFLVCPGPDISRLIMTERYGKLPKTTGNAFPTDLCFRRRGSSSNDFTEPDRGASVSQRKTFIH